MTRRQILTLVIIFAIAAGIWQGTEIVQETRSNTAEVHKLTNETHNLVTSLQSAVVESCEENGNARAAVLRETLHEEIKAAEHPDPVAFHALVTAGVPPHVIRQIEAKQIVVLDGRLKKIKISDCQSQYKISPGSGDRRRDRTP